jgi:hypothetical protein
MAAATLSNTQLLQIWRIEESGKLLAYVLNLSRPELEDNTNSPGRPPVVGAATCLRGGITGRGLFEPVGIPEAV